MKITAFYYLDYPSELSHDETYAATEMRVETGQDGDNIEHFMFTYAFQVYTFKYVQDVYFRNGLSLTGRSILIVPDLSSERMSKFLDENIEMLNDWAEQMT